MKYRCLILDHDDTAVESTAAIHYPAHLECMRRMRPESPAISLEKWFEKNFHPGILAFLTEELGFNDEEMALEYSIWREFTSQRNPPFFPGLSELLKDFTASGGILAVVSHSEESNIRRHYRLGTAGVEPAYILGWEQEETKRKPHPWPVEHIMTESGLDTGDVLVVDDLKPGVDMARAAGVTVAAAGWGHSVPSIVKAMKEICDFWLPDVAALRRHILD